MTDVVLTIANANTGHIKQAELRRTVAPVLVARKHFIRRGWTKIARPHRPYPNQFPDVMGETWRKGRKFAVITWMTT